MVLESKKFNLDYIYLNYYERQRESVPLPGGGEVEVPRAEHHPVPGQARVPRQEAQP